MIAASYTIGDSPTDRIIRPNAEKTLKDGGEAMPGWRKDFGGPE
jgi:hypothetical protein